MPTNNCTLLLQDAVKLTLSLGEPQEQVGEALRGIAAGAGRRPPGRREGRGLGSAAHTGGQRTRGGSVTSRCPPAPCRPFWRCRRPMRPARR